MKKNYFTTFNMLIIYVVFSLKSLAQVTPINNTLNLNNHVSCTMEVTDEVNKIFIPRRDAVIARMSNSNRMDCSTINVIYNNFPTNVINPSLPGPEQQAFQFAVDIWKSLLDTNVPITINANWANLGASTLGSAGSAFFAEVSGGGTNILYPAPLAEKLTGSEINGANSIDINCNFNSQFPNWYFGTDGNTPAADFDFVTIVLHEIGHGLGIAGFGRQLTFGGTDVGSIRRTINGNLPSSLNDPNAIYANIWDTFVQNEDIFTNNVPILDETNYPDPSATLLGGMTNNLLTSSSPTAIAQNNNVLPLYSSPNPFVNGSSYSHWDEGTFNGTATALMTPQAARGEAIHDPGDVTLGLMEDMGWTICNRVLSTENFTIDNIKLSPNPFTESITLDIPSSLTNQSFNINITDINGRVVLSQKENIATSGKININKLSSLTNALYFLTIESTTSDLKITKKIIKK